MVVRVRALTSTPAPGMEPTTAPTPILLNVVRLLLLDGNEFALAVLEELCSGRSCRRWV
jgi:hypothetical protein